MNVRLCLTAAAVVVVAACGGPPGPGDSAYPFNVEGEYSGTVSVEGEGFAGGMQLMTESGGVVTGTFEVSQPVQIGGVVEGTLVGDRLTLFMSYRNNPMTGCDGSVSGTVTVAEGGGVFSGPVTVSDCGDALGASMRFTRTMR